MKKFGNQTSLTCRFNNDDIPKRFTMNTSGIDEPFRVPRVVGGFMNHIFLLVNFALVGAE